MSIPKKKGGRRGITLENAVKLAVPGENDILCGKDRSCSLHKGSQHFKTVIDSYRAAYQKTKTKYDKMQITKEIYDVLSQTSRFLKYNDAEKLWEEISPLAARDKVGHALRFANNHQPSSSRKKTITKQPRVNRQSPPLHRRQGSFSSSSIGSGAYSASASTATSTNASHVRVPTATKAELVASLVEVAKEEPKVWDSVVDHLTHQQQEHHQYHSGDPAVGVPGDATNVANHHHHLPSANEVDSSSHDDCYQTGFADPVALENIAYAVDTKTDDEALDELIHMLNNDATEEYIQDVLDQAAMSHAPQVPPSVTVNISVEQPREPSSLYNNNSSSSTATAEPAFSYSGHYSAAPTITNHNNNLATQQQQQQQQPHVHKHKRIYSVDDDMWSVMKEPLPLLEDLDTITDGDEWR